MYDVALTLRDSILNLDRSRHPHVSYQADWGKQFYDSMEIFRPLFEMNPYTLTDKELKDDEMRYEAESDILNESKDD